MDHAAENVDPTKGENVVRIDLQDIYRANPKAFIAASAVIAAAFAFLVIKGVSSSGSSSPSAKPAAAHGTTTSPSAATTTAAAGVTTPDPNYHPAYADEVPQIASASGDRDAARGPAAGGRCGRRGADYTCASVDAELSRGVGECHSSDPTGYAVAFTEELLDRDYADAAAASCSLGRKRRPPRRCCRVSRTPVAREDAVRRTYGSLASAGLTGSRFRSATHVESRCEGWSHAARVLRYWRRPGCDMVGDS